jgi:tetratricopeptide (TPR) repeat protein
MVPTNLSDKETRDAEHVDEALKALATSDSESAERILASVIANTPNAYSNSTEHEDGSLSIKFWDVQGFMHYVTWSKHHGIERCVKWIRNAYPRAHYYMGFLCVKIHQYERAIEYLTRGHQLEPTNPKFNFEKAHALAQLGETETALSLYAAITDMGPHVTAWDVAIARRGRGFVLIEMQRLDEAEEAFNASLEIEPGNEVALNELRYIQNLRNGGDATHGETVSTSAPDPLLCAMCGQQIAKGSVVAVNGMPRSICNRCVGKLNKKWWQFWK